MNDLIVFWCNIVVDSCFSVNLLCSKYSEFVCWSDSRPTGAGVRTPNEMLFISCNCSKFMNIPHISTPKELTVQKECSVTNLLVGCA